MHSHCFWSFVQPFCTAFSRPAIWEKCITQLTEMLSVTQFQKMLTHVPNGSQTKRTCTAVSNAHLHLPNWDCLPAPVWIDVQLGDSALLAAPSLFLAYSNWVILGSSNSGSLKTALSLSQSWISEHILNLKHLLSSMNLKNTSNKNIK